MSARVDSRYLSVVVQGPCLRTADTNGAPAIDTTLASVRRSFPNAQIILSTWQGSNTAGLDVDELLLNADPGPLLHPDHKPNNFNRLLRSVSAGLAAATRPFCIKTRNDVLFTGDALAHKPLWPAAPYLSLERRIWITSWGTGRLVTSLNPFHPSDLVHFGATEDLRRLWIGAPVTTDDVFDVQHGAIAKMVPEQCLAVGYVRRLGHDIELRNTYDGRMEILSASLDFMLGAFDIFDGRDEGVVLPTRFFYGSPSIETPDTFNDLRKRFYCDRLATCRNVYQEFWQLIEQIREAALRNTPRDVGLPCLVRQDISAC